MGFRAGVVIGGTIKDKLFEKISMADFGVEPPYNSQYSKDIEPTYRCEELPNNILNLFSHFDDFGLLMCTARIRIVFGRELYTALVEAYPEYSDSIFTVEELFGVPALTLLKENARHFDVARQDDPHYLVCTLSDLIQSFSIFGIMVRHLAKDGKRNILFSCVSK